MRWKLLSPISKKNVCNPKLNFKFLLIISYSHLEYQPVSIQKWIFFLQNEIFQKFKFHTINRYLENIALKITVIGLKIKLYTFFSPPTFHRKIYELKQKRSKCKRCNPPNSVNNQTNLEQAFCFQFLFMTPINSTSYALNLK